MSLPAQQPRWAWEVGSGMTVARESRSAPPPDVPRARRLRGPRRTGLRRLARIGSRRVDVAGSVLLAVSCATLAPTAGAHDWYEDLKAPRGGMCCTDRDCQPVDHRYNPEKRRTEVGIDGTWVPVDPAELVPVPSVDGSAHACFERRWALGKMTPVIRCVILPGEV
jgi:hypothetical protein